MSIRKGQRFAALGAKWRVAYANESRAHCVATSRGVVVIRGPAHGTERVFEARKTLSMDISPETDVALLAEILP